MIGLQVEFHELKSELSEMQNQYESLLNDSTNFPSAGGANQK
jgi:hypothetical protein